MTGYADTVEGLYAAFGPVRRPERVPGCPHCVGPDEDLPLLDRPLRSLPADDLSRYASKALSTWGGVEEFRYFLPRLLECTAAGIVATDPQVVFGKLAAAGWRGWADDERTAIEDFLTAWWDRTLTHHPARPDVGTALCCLGRTEADLDPFLDRWGRLESVATVRHLHELVLYGVRWADRPRLADAFWAVESAAHAQVVVWLTGGRAAAAVEAAFATSAREDVLRSLDEIYPFVRPA